MGIKRNTKAVCLALAAMFAFGAIAAGSAQANLAPRWTVAGSTLTAGQTETFHASSTGTVALTGGGVFLKSVNNGDCTFTGKIEGSGAGESGKLREAYLICHNLETYTSTGTTIPTCIIHSPGEANGTIKTNNIDGKLVWLNQNGNTEVGATLTPEAGTEFFSIEVTGASCPVKGTYPITGTTVGKVEPVGSDATEGFLTFPSTAITTTWSNATPRVSATDGLLIKTSAAVFENISPGKFDVKLEPCALWGVEAA
jgi:hypothetical protein